MIWAHGLSPVSLPPPCPPPPKEKKKRPFISFAPPLFRHKNAQKKEKKKKKKKYNGGCCFALAMGRTGISRGSDTRSLCLFLFLLTRNPDSIVIDIAHVVAMLCHA